MSAVDDGSEPGEQLKASSTGIWDVGPGDEVQQVNTESSTTVQLQLQHHSSAAGVLDVCQT